MLRQILMVLSFLLLALPSMASMAETSFDRIPFPNRPGQPERPFPPPPGRETEFLYQNINRLFVGQNLLPLRQILNIGPQYSGQRIVQVILRARSNGGAMANLIINNFRTGPDQMISPFGQELQFFPDRYNDKLDDQIRNLQILLQGQVFVEGVGVQIANESGHFPGDRFEETAVIQQNFSGNNRLELDRFINLARHRGQILRTVILRASTARGMGRASICGSRGCTVQQQIGTSLQNYQFETRESVDRFLSLDLQGNFWIDSITLQFTP